MVEQRYGLDEIFGCLRDPTRRDIVKRLSRTGGLRVSDIAAEYDLSLAAVAKHLKIMTAAKLVRKTRQGKEQIVTLVPAALAAADDYLETYRALWEERLDSLDKYLKSIKK